MRGRGIWSRSPNSARETAPSSRSNRNSRTCRGSTVRTGGSPLHWHRSHRRNVEVLCPPRKERSAPGVQSFDLSEINFCPKKKKLLVDKKKDHGPPAPAPQEFHRRTENRPASRSPVAG